MRNSNELVKAMTEAIAKSQAVLSSYVKPESEITAEDAINELLGIQLIIHRRV